MADISTSELETVLELQLKKEDGKGLSHDQIQRYFGADKFFSDLPTILKDGSAKEPYSERLLKRFQESYNNTVPENEKLNETGHLDETTRRAIGKVEAEHASAGIPDDATRAAMHKVIGENPTHKFESLYLAHMGDDDFASNTKFIRNFQESFNRMHEQKDDDGKAVTLNGKVQYKDGYVPLDLNGKMNKETQIALNEVRHHQPERSDAMMATQSPAPPIDNLQTPLASTTVTHTISVDDVKRVEAELNALGQHHNRDYEVAKGLTREDGIAGKNVTKDLEGLGITGGLTAQAINRVDELFKAKNGNNQATVVQEQEAELGRVAKGSERPTSSAPLVASNEISPNLLAAKLAEDPRLTTLRGQIALLQSDAENKTKAGDTYQAGLETDIAKFLTRELDPANISKKDPNTILGEVKNQLVDYVQKAAEGTPPSVSQQTPNNPSAAHSQGPGRA